MNAFLSKKIKFINLVLCSMIVFLHATYKYLPGEYATGELVNFQFEMMRYLTVVMATAVPTFFVMSAYLFFITYQGLKDYVPKIKKRVVSVAIPYFIFGVGTYIYYYILVNYTNLFDSKTIPDDIIGVIKYILLCEGNPPLWYLRTLFCFFVWSPIIYFVMSKLKRTSIILVFVIYFVNVIHMPAYNSLLHWLPQILIGTWLALYGQDFIKQAKRYSPKVFWGALCIGICYSFFLFVMNNEYHWLFYTWRVISVGILWIIVSGINLEKIDYIPEYSFFMYCTHFIVIEAVRGVLIKLIGVSSWSVGVIFILTFVLTVICIHVVANIIKKYIPRVWSIINGGR